MSIPRRCLAVASAGLVLYAVTGSPATASAAPPDSPPAVPDGWTFTDDLGNTVTLEEAPVRVVALSDVAYSLINYGVEPVGIFGYSGIADDVRFDELDTSGIVELGTIYGEINLEALAAADPDLIVTNQYPADASGSIDESEPLYGFADSEQQDAVERIAPIVTIVMGGSAADVIERTTELAVALGASPDDGVIPESRASFEAAGERLAAAAEREVNVVVLYAELGSVYVTKAPDDPSMRMYAELGVDFVDPGGEDYYWEIFSWENFPTLEADLVLYSERGLLADDLMDLPTFAATPAAAAGQVYPWVFSGMDYVSSAAYMEQLAGWLESAEIVR